MELIQDKWLRLWLLWIAAIALSNSRISSTISELLMSIIYVNYYSPLFFLFFVLPLILGGVIPGIAQWLVLRSHIDISGWLWILTAILGNVISIYMENIGSGLAGFMISRGVSGLLIGSMQWLILRQRIKHAGWWIVILTAWQLISALVIIVIFLSFPSAMFRMDILSTILYGAVTGAGLVILLRQSSNEKMLAGSLI